MFQSYTLISLSLIMLTGSRNFIGSRIVITYMFMGIAKYQNSVTHCLLLEDVVYTYTQVSINLHASQYHTTVMIKNVVLLRDLSF